MGEMGLHFTVKDNTQSLQHIKAYQASVARFGDGEIDIIAGNSIPYQEYNQDLAHQLREIIGSESTEGFLVCLPDVFENMERYNSSMRAFWQGHLAHYHELYQDICRAPWYGSTFISRPYIDLENKEPAKEYFEQLKLLWADKDILIVEGETSRSGVGNDLFSGAKSISRIICPSRNAYSQYDVIADAIRQHGKDKLVLLMLGPTAKVLSYNLSKEGYWAIDLGHIDSEYEWFLMGATHKVKLDHKHTAEHNYDQNITFLEDNQYGQQILCYIEQPLISVVVPVYNVLPYLDECLQSICRQTYKNLEIILVDDGSTDGSADKCYRYAYEDERIKVIHKTNGGLSDARNVGLEAATGHYLTFVDSDDAIAEDFIERLYNRLKAYQADVAVSSFYTYNSDTYSYGFYTSENRDHIVEVLSAQECLNYQCQSVPYIGPTMVTAWGKLYERSLFNNIRFPIGKKFEDGMTTHKLLLKAKKVVLDGKKNYQYRVRENSIMAQAFGNEELLKSARHAILASQIKLLDVVLAGLDTGRERFFAAMSLYNMRGRLEEHQLTDTHEYLALSQLLDLYEKGESGYFKKD